MFYGTKLKPGGRGEYKVRLKTVVDSGLNNNVLCEKVNWRYF